MKYRQFKNSAERHLRICEKLLLRLEDRNISKIDAAFIRHEVYYLSGYIIETLISYALCNHLHIEEEIEENEHFKDNPKFKTHALTRKYNYAKKHNCHLADIIFLSKACSNRKLQDLFENWDVKYRYETPSIPLDKDDLEAYIKEIRNIYLIILLRYPL